VAEAWQLRHHAAVCGCGIPETGPGVVTPDPADSIVDEPTPTMEIKMRASQADILGERVAGLTMALGLLVNELGNIMPEFSERMGSAIDRAITGLKPDHQGSGSATVLLQLRSAIDQQQRARGEFPPERH
jgi:hypothetical protein